MSVSWLDSKLYPDYDDNWDDILFRQTILGLLTPSSEVLDVGAGAGIVSQMNFMGHAGNICGIDLDTRVQKNPHLHEGRVASGEDIPYPDNSFDLVFSDNVLEHLDNPAAVFSEVMRVLRPGGSFLVKTPNKWHYVATIARLTPHRFHQFVNRARGRSVEDTFPTRYRANSRRTLTKLAEKSGLRVREIQLIEGRPEYLRMNAITYVLGWLYESVVNAVGFLAMFRVLIIARLDKPDSAGGH